MKNIYILAILLIVISTSCLSKRALPKASLVPDYNQRISVQNAYFKKRLSFTGVLISGSVAGVGALAANEAKLTTFYNDKNEKITNEPLNYGLGGVSGLGVSFLFHDAGGWGKEKKVDDKNKRNKWIRKKIGNPNNYIIQNTSQLEVFTLVKKTAQNSWVIKNMQDLDDFLLLFPDTDGGNMLNVAKQSFSVLATNVDATMAIRKKFENTLVKDYVNEEAGNRASEQVNNYSSLDQFANQYPSHKKISELVARVTPQATRQELRAMIGQFYQANTIDETKKRYINTANNLSDYLDAINIADPKNQFFSVSTVENRAFSLIEGLQDAILFKNSFSNSKYVHRYSDRTFIGTLQDERRSGKGIMLYGNNEYYDGQWANDLKNGYGTYQNTSVIYQGYFRDGKYHGKGKLQKTNGEIYEGSFEDDLYHGKAEWVCPAKNIKKYIGSFSNGNPEGYGELTYTNADLYIGQFQEGKRHGKGKMIVKEEGDIFIPRVYEGTFENDLKEGKFTLIQEGVRDRWLDVVISYEKGVEVDRKEYKDYYKYRHTGNEADEKIYLEKERESNEERKYICEGNVSVPSYKQKNSGYEDRDIIVEFKDGLSGTLFFDQSKGEYYISDGGILGVLPRHYYYKSFSLLIKALYIYKKASGCILREGQK